MSCVKSRKKETVLPAHIRCPFCDAPSSYLYFNDGKIRRQIKCKVCTALFIHSQKYPRQEKTKFWCPHCNNALYRWKYKRNVTFYKCPNDKCPEYVRNKEKLNPLEKIMQTVKSSQYKLRYQYRDYHFSDEQLAHSKPLEFPEHRIFNIRKSLSDLCLALTFHISLGISARKTAYILTNVVQKKTSYQTILNYTQYAATFCHRFNINFKEPADITQVGDETYIKIKGKHAYVFFFISPDNRAITAYHIDNSRDTLPATVAIKEAVRTAPENLPLTVITDGNPSYQAGIHFLNKTRKPAEKIQNIKVVGLQNLDKISEEFRPFKQIIERLNRTYKFHIRAANGFNTKNGAVALTTLFVTYYNFIRPHASMHYKPPIIIPVMISAKTLQEKWAILLKKAFDI